MTVDRPSGSQSVERALALLRCVGQRVDDGMPLAELVRRSVLTKPTVRRLLIALTEAGFVEQHPVTRRYFPGQEMYVLGSLATRRFGLLQMAMPGLVRLARASGDTAFLSVPRGCHAICLHRQEGGYPVRTHVLQAGDEHPLGIGAGSLAMLAAMPDSAVESTLAEVGPELADAHPTVAVEALLDGVRQARVNGYSLNPGLIFADSWGLGVAIRYPDRTVAGALSLAAIESRMGPARRSELAALLKQEVALIEERLKSLFADHISPRKTEGVA